MQVFPFSRQVLQNITETAPETWTGSHYDEKSDIFSFAIILWRLFGSAGQETEYHFLQQDGRFLPPPKQRELIQKV